MRDDFEPPLTTADFAYGIGSMFDNIPDRTTAAIKYKMRAYFGRARFQRIRRKELGFSPADQEYIASVFKEYGVHTPPRFDFHAEANSR